MKHITKLKLASVHILCNEEDRSTEYTMQLMQDICKVGLDCVLSYMELDNKEVLFKEVNDFVNIILKIQEE